MAKIEIISDKILVLIDQAGGKVSSLYELNRRLKQQPSTRNMMALSRECDRLEAIGLITTKRVGKSKEIRITSSGQQYIAFRKYPTPKIKLLWKKY